MGASAGRPQPHRIVVIAEAVFGRHARDAECIAHYESTDGAHLFNGPSLGPWQIDTDYHPWVNTRRLVVDWWYSARVAWIISKHGTDWGPWSTRHSCGV